jgi:hypothetical protein
MIGNYHLLALVGWLACACTGCSDRGAANSTVVDRVETALPTDSTTTDEPETAASEDDSLDDAFCGTWQLEDHGLRTVLLKPDGTATMHVQLDFFASLLYGEEMMMDLTWSIEDGVLSYTIVGGEPVESIDKVIADFGRERSYRILTVGDDRIQLEDVTKPGKIHDWMNVGELPEQG